jgi:hypothetical protein
MATRHFDPIGKFLYTKDDMGNYHSYDDQPAIEYLDGSELKIWYKNGLIHRDGKHAIIIKNYDGIMIKEFYCNGIKWKFTIPDILLTTFNIEKSGFNMKTQVNSFIELNNYLQLCFSELKDIYKNGKQIRSIYNEFLFEKFNIYVTKGQNTGCEFMFPNDYFIRDEDDNSESVKKMLQIFGLEYNDFIIGNRYDYDFNGCGHFIFRDEFIKALIQKCYTPEFITESMI